ncbi:ADP-ribose pyrophosphatase YjhB (NUDIX family) [Nakamurella sp. UYEF19]|uniref:NUDIX hydrolase n=1 Tax=Nakamurella sp. UYEF19 TaxID=1756392 RepID=UPI003397FF28
MVGTKLPEKPLTDYPRPSVAVDVAVLTVRDGQLEALAVEHRRGGLALPGTFLHEGETLAVSAERALREKAGLDGIKFRQLRVFDDPKRDDRGWVLSVGHVAAIAAELLPERAELLALRGDVVQQAMLFDHAAIVTAAVQDLRDHYGRFVDPDRLLGERFTVLSLRQLYEAIFGHPLVKDTFRRHIKDHIDPTGDVERDVVGKPAALFTRRPDAPLPPSAGAFFLRDAV